MVFTKERFWKRVNKTATCWLWTGPPHGNNGYGVTCRHGKVQKAHVVAYELTHGSVPEGRKVLHKCDTPLCVRPDHLFIGSQRDNALDMLRKGRATYAKLSFDVVRKIRTDLKHGTSGVELSKKYNVSKSTISMIKNNLIWKDECRENPSVHQVKNGEKDK
jgi:hypothetical protein